MNIKKILFKIFEILQNVQVQTEIFVYNCLTRNGCTIDTNVVTVIRTL